MRTIWTGLMVAALALAGCADDTPHDHLFECEDGTTVDVSNEDHHNATFDPEAACTPEPLVVVLADVPATVGVYTVSTISFDLSLGKSDFAHSMDNQIRVATESMALGPEDGPDVYGDMIGRMEHEDLPVAFTADFAPTEPGVYYIRGYAVVEGVHLWSDEHIVDVAPVQPTGESVTITHAIGDFVGGVSPTEADLALGDAVVFQNDDVIEHTFTFASGPEMLEAVTVAAGSASDQIMLPAPGTYEVVSDDQQNAATVVLRVALP